MSMLQAKKLNLEFQNGSAPLSLTFNEVFTEVRFDRRIVWIALEP